jgi:hypothetical protein
MDDLGNSSAGRLGGKCIGSLGRRHGRGRESIGAVPAAALAAVAALPEIGFGEDEEAVLDGVVAAFL